MHTYCLLHFQTLCVIDLQYIRFYDNLYLHNILRLFLLFALWGHQRHYGCRLKKKKWWKILPGKMKEKYFGLHGTQQWAGPVPSAICHFLKKQSERLFVFSLKNSQIYFSSCCSTTATFCCPHFTHPPTSITVLCAVVSHKVKTTLETNSNSLWNLPYQPDTQIRVSLTEKQRRKFKLYR
jgi:hypothetical protein